MNKRPNDPFAEDLDRLGSLGVEADEGSTAGATEEEASEEESAHDPLEGLIERTKPDSAAPFEEEVLRALAELKKADRYRFEALRAELKRIGFKRLTALDEAINAITGGSSRPSSQIDELVELAAAAELFHTPDGTAFAVIQINNHREVWLIQSKGFRRWMIKLHLEATEGAPSSEALKSALNAIEAKAIYDGKEEPLFVRVAARDGKLYLDLCDDAWQAIEITAFGWRIVNDPPVHFRRSAGEKRLPDPVRGGTIKALRPFLNVRSETEFVLAVAWLLACLRNNGPYPVMAVSGEQGSAKSTFVGILRALIDPNTAPLRALPREDRDLFITATNSHVLAFDNVSGLPHWLSDTFCRLATGGGFAVRQLYTDQDEVLFNATRPVMLNGIDEFITRPDLADRALVLTLQSIGEQDRRPEAEVWSAFESKLPAILGALLDGVVEGLRRLPEVRLPNLPRMADFVLWAVACETAYWPAGTFWSAYNDNLDEAVETVIEGDLVANAVKSFMLTTETWTGTATDLLEALRADDETTSKAKEWPRTPRALSNRLRRAATFLRKVGINVRFEREGRERTRTIQIDRNGSDSASAKSASSAPRGKDHCDSDFGEPSVRTQTPGADASDEASVREKSREDNGADAADDADDSAPNDQGCTQWRRRL